MAADQPSRNNKMFSKSTLHQRSKSTHRLGTPVKNSYGYYPNSKSELEMTMKNVIGGGDKIN